MRIARCLLAVAFAAASFASAQTRQQVPVAPEPTGTILGHVFCSDTNEPARFADVYLQAIPAPSKTKPTAPVSDGMGEDASGAGRVQTTLDGSFTLRHVKPGSYYVIVDKPGYLGPHDIFTNQELKDASPETLARRAELIAHVSVEADHTESVEIRLERGASISGTILYDDGSPAGGLNVQLLNKNAKGEWVRLELNRSINRNTDDRGVFRAASLLPGDYIIEADLSLASSKMQNMTFPGNMNVSINVQTFSYSLPFYGTGTPHRADAKPVTLLAGQETPGQDMILPIAKLHKITGHVAAGRDAHFVNAASVALVSREDNTELASTDISREDGLFHLEFVPDGDYTLKVTEARDVVWEMTNPSKDQPFNTQERVIASFGDTEESLIVRGDILDTLATVSPDATPNHTKPAAVNAQTGTPQPDGTSEPSPAKPQPQDPAPQAKSTTASTI